MTGTSLGQRTGSYGSLPQHLQTQTTTAFLQIQTTTSPIIIRKPSKMLISGSRDKEKFISRFFKFTSRRGFGMFLLVVSVVVCMTVLSAICKDDVAPEGANLFQDDVASKGNGLHHRSTLYVQNNTSSRMPPHHQESSQIVDEHDKKMVNGDQIKENISAMQNLVPADGENQSQLLPPVVDRRAFPNGHPCEKFVFPPPPSDRKRTGPRPCPVCYLPVEQAIVQMPDVPSTSPVLQNLTYIYEEDPVRTELFGGSEFGGYPSLKQRNESFDIKESMNVHCGFVKGHKPGRQTGFDIDDADLFEMDQCHGIVVASAIFGNYDIIQQPKNVSEAAKKNICFFMFVDEETEAYIKNSSALDSRNKVGLWRIVVIRNLPYGDARRNGKVPKLLLHRIFPHARFSLWIDGKLELVVDPYQILERFLWRNGATFAISRHYRRFDVFKEAEANKAAGKYDNASIDFQVDFYKREGLTPYSVAKLPITSDVPEGCVIIREHIPITNLFTCLWFNEVDRFTSRDQLSFSTVRDKIISKVNWSINMFMDCERRNFVVQAYHRDLLEHMSHPPALIKQRPAESTPIAIAIQSPPALSKERPAESTPEITTNKVEKRKTSPKRGRDRKSRRHRKIAAGSRGLNRINFLL
ncbi:Inner membrane protein oxaa [Thalictrum thalictroides]|uniref:Inner membrane protein oxaa n=1 Tax=Thalictrum thalictroides TaxID=46969 RepID=A0A7J6WJU1_THATH|nr:Inner membrane protein oxaa [Thalictrum thalictroides]